MELSDSASDYEISDIETRKPSFPLTTSRGSRVRLPRSATPKRISLVEVSESDTEISTDSTEDKKKGQKRKAASTLSKKASKKVVSRTAKEKKTPVASAKATPKKKKVRKTKAEIADAERIAKGLAASTVKFLEKRKSNDAAAIAQVEGLKKAYDRGILEPANADSEIQNVEGELLPDAVHNCNTQEIKVNKSVRKQRYMFVFPGQISIREGGIFGSVSDLDTPTPKMNIDFPDQRVTLTGTIVYPHDRYMYLRCHNKGKSIMCDEVFDRLVVFHDYSVVKLPPGLEKHPEKVDDRDIDWNAPTQYGVSRKIVKKKLRGEHKAGAGFLASTDSGSSTLKTSQVNISQDGSESDREEKFSQSEESELGDASQVSRASLRRKSSSNIKYKWDSDSEELSTQENGTSSSEYEG